MPADNRISPARDKGEWGVDHGSEVAEAGGLAMQAAMEAFLIFPDPLFPEVNRRDDAGHWLYLCQKLKL
ncbi:hypothetical protein GQ457_07G015440 [Hibiscus cannabinus]